MAFAGACGVIMAFAGPATAGSQGRGAERRRPAVLVVIAGGAPPSSESEMSSIESTGSTRGTRRGGVIGRRPRVTLDARIRT
eukprot:995001-Lingulodinium_polyedra.AAC.1